MAALALALPIAQLVIPQIPSIITFVEALIGAGNGDKKKAAAVNLLQLGLTDAANAGKLPSAAVLDPGLPAALGVEVQKAFDNPKTNPLAGTSAAKSVPALAAAAAPKAPTTCLVSGNGRTFLLIEV